MTDLRRLLNIKYPIFQGGMAHIATGQFAAAVSNAGALGIIAAGALTPDGLGEEIETARALTNKPLGVNLMLMHPQVDELAQVAAQARVEVITTGAGLPGKYLPLWKQAGIRVFPVVPSVASARRMAAQGADGVIAEGGESGGHVGDLTTMALVPQVCRAVEIPVLAAGGVATGEQFLAALALGACGVQIGTTLLRTQECPIHSNYKAALLRAKDISTTVTGRAAGAPVRLLRNAMSLEYIRREKEGASLEELERFTLGSLRRAVFEGDVETGSLMAGQVAGLLDEVLPLETLLARLYADCLARVEALRRHPALEELS